MKLTDVARASLSELRGDYEIWILDRGQFPWSAHSPEAKTINAISLDAAPFSGDVVHESACHALEQRKKHAQWLDSDDELVVANAMLIIIGRAPNMRKSQIESQGVAFGETGGFSERMTAKRIEAREKSREPSPRVPSMHPTHAPPQIRQRRILGLLRLPRMQRNPPYLTACPATLQPGRSCPRPNIHYSSNLNTAMNAC